MNVLKPFDLGITSNEDAIRDLEDYESSIDDIVNVNGIEVVRSDYDVLNGLVPGYSFGRIVEESRILFTDKRVSHLDLYEMGLGSLSSEIGKLDRLEELNLGFNKLSVLPEELCDLPNLEALYVDDNPLSNHSIVDKLKEKGVEVLR